MTATKVLGVVGTRPNFMKMAPVLTRLEARSDEFEVRLVHTGQHYDAAMSDVFFRELAMRTPDHLLDVGPGTHAQQTARVMERLEPVLIEEAPAVLLVPGDVNSTLAAALVAAKLEIPIGHIEAGLRSFDRSMPEEVNRIVTDRLSELLFTHSPEAERHLLSEGAEPSSIHYVGNTMIDTLVALRAQIDAEAGASERGLTPGDYVLVTLHRPALVDGPLLAEAVAGLTELARTVRVVFPVHPRTRKAIERLDPVSAADGLRLLEPLGYLEFLRLLRDAAAVLTDSGGIQEEATFLGIPCLTLRDNTERPVTISMGTNVLLGLRPERIAELPEIVDEVRARVTTVPPLWDGQAAGRIADVLAGLRRTPV